MAAICSDTFDGMADDADLEGRTLDNGLGGSGSRTWVRAGWSVSQQGDGSNKVERSRFLVGEDGQGVSLGSNTNAKARVKFRFTSSFDALLIVFGKSNRAHYAADGGQASIGTFYHHSTTQLRLRAQDGSEPATQNITALSLDTDYYLELEINGNNVVGRILNSDTSVRNTVSYTYSSGAPTGNYWGFGSFSSNSGNYRLDNWYMDDLAAAGTPALLSRTPRGVAEGIMRGVSLRTSALLSRYKALIVPSLAKGVI